jgi:hypothetical protein
MRRPSHTVGHAARFCDHHRLNRTVTGVARIGAIRRSFRPAEAEPAAVGQRSLSRAGFSRSCSRGANRYLVADACVPDCSAALARAIPSTTFHRSLRPEHARSEPVSHATGLHGHPAPRCLHWMAATDGSRSGSPATHRFYFRSGVPHSPGCPRLLARDSSRKSCCCPSTHCFASWSNSLAVCCLSLLRCCSLIRCSATSHSARDSLPNRCSTMEPANRLLRLPALLDSTRIGARTKAPALEQREELPKCEPSSSCIERFESNWPSWLPEVIPTGNSISMSRK